jgi:tRNA(fMet)-specific endonuclease VapC
MLDTNIASYLIKGTHPSVSDRVARLPMEALTISAVTEGELIYGLERKPQASSLRRLVEAFLPHVSILPWNSAAARRYGALRAEMERQGKPLGGLDTMIGAHALVAGTVLVTHDDAFRRIAGLAVEDWTLN